MQDAPFHAPHGSHRQRHNDLAAALLVPRQAPLEADAALTLMADLPSVSVPATLLLAPTSSSQSAGALAAAILSSSALSVAPPDATATVIASSSAAAATTTTAASTHTESHATHVNAGTLAAMQSLMATFSLFFALYALWQLPWTVVRLSRSGWRVGWRFGTKQPGDKRTRGGMRYARSTSAAVSGKAATEKMASTSSTNLVPVSLSEAHYNQGWPSPSSSTACRASTPLQRIPRTAFFPHHTYRLPVLNVTLRDVVVFLPFALVATLASVVKAHYLWDATRTGFVPLAMLPFIFALGWKAGGLGTILQVGYASLAALHRWLARLCFLITTLHVISYMIVFDLKGTMKVQMSDLVNIEAWIGYGGMFVMTLVSCGPIRRRWYHLFKLCHHGGLVLFLGGMNYHSPSVFPYLMVAILCTAANYLYRFATARLHVAELTPLKGAGVVIITVPGVKSGWFPGQHVRIRVLSGGMGLLGLESHPFTCASATGSSDGLRLVIKSNGDWTTKLFAAAGGHENDDDADEKLPKRVVMEVSGPYGRANFIASTFASVAVIVGGSGISYGLAVVEGIVQDCLSGNGRTSDVELVWTVRESELLAHTLPYFHEILQAALDIPAFTITVRLHCTASSFPPASVAALSLKALRGNRSLAPVVVYGERPDLQTVVDSLAVRTHAGGGLAVCSCGPQALVDGVARLVDDMDKDRKARVGVECTSELFSL